VHHTYFVKEISSRFALVAVITESSMLVPPFETTHSFEVERDHYETSMFFGGQLVTMADFTHSYIVSDINNDNSRGLIASYEPDIVIVFGTRRIGKEIIDLCKEGFVNLHGGDPEQYRGLDSHLWGIYHGDFGSLAVTLHRVNEKLDDGEILARETIALSRDMRLYQLRKANTELCVDITMNTLNRWVINRTFKSWKQQRIGRYYSFMPSVLKNHCVSKFEHYTTELNDGPDHLPD